MNLARCHAVLTDTQPPSLAELRELVAALEEISCYETGRLASAYAAVLAAYPFLREGRSSDAD